MSHRTVLAALVAALVAVAGTAAAEDPIREAQRHQQQAATAYQAGDYATFTAETERAFALNPRSFATRYNLACGYARLGRADDAMALLRELAAARVDFGMARDPDLESLRERADFRALLADLEASIVPVSRSTEVHRIAQLGILPEGIAYDPASGRTFLGSMRTGDLYVFDRDGRLSRFAAIDRGGRLAAIGLTVDPKRKLLLAAGSSISTQAGFDPAAPTRAGVFGFDLSTGELKRADVLEDSKGALFNDLAVAPSGETYLSGTVLHRVPAAGGTPEPVALDPPIPQTNGLAVTPDGRTLYISVYPAGLARVDLGAGTWRYVEGPRGTPLLGIDGLYFFEGDLVAIQNGVQPWRLLRLTLDAAGTTVTKVRVLEFANPDLVATTGAIHDGVIDYVGAGPAPEDPPSQFPASLAANLGEVVVMRAPLGEPASAK